MRILFKQRSKHQRLFIYSINRFTIFRVENYIFQCKIQDYLKLS